MIVTWIHTKILFVTFASAFIPNHKPYLPRNRLHQQSSSLDDHALPEQAPGEYDPISASKFKILTCCATSCAQKRRVLGLGEYDTFAAFWQRIQDRIPEITVTECSCLGSCQQAPCVAIEHDEYDGTVALEGMDASEFEQRVFHRVIDETDADRVWDCVENAIQLASKVIDE